MVAFIDAQTIALPDWHGNNRIESLRNIVRDGRVSLMFLIPGANNALRINVTARLTADDALRARFDRDGKQPRTVIVIRLTEVYSQCARALIRPGLWTGGDQSKGLPGRRHAARNQRSLHRRQGLRRRLAHPRRPDDVVSQPLFGDFVPHRFAPPDEKPKAHEEAS